MKIVNTCCLQTPTQLPGAHLLVILTKDDTGMYAVYIGIVPLVPPENELYADQRADAADWVADHGDKQTYLSAQRYFPGLAEKTYRA